MAGIACIDPDPLTLRELCWRAHAKNRADWNRTSHVLATLLNVNRGSKNDPVYTPEQLNPYAKKRKRKKKPRYYVSIATVAKAMVKASR